MTKAQRSWLYQHIKSREKLQFDALERILGTLWHRNDFDSAEEGQAAMQQQGDDLRVPLSAMLNPGSLEGIKTALAVGAESPGSHKEQSSSSSLATLTKEDFLRVVGKAATLG